MQKILLKSVIILLLIKPAVILAEGNLPPYPAITNAGAREMAQAYVYYMGQSISVKQLSEKLPKLASELNRAQLGFDRIFKSAVETIDLILSKDNNHWSKDKPQLLRDIEASFDNNLVTAEQVKQFIDEIDNRSKGVIPSPILESLLIYKPAFIRYPADEFSQGYIETFHTIGHPKAKGVDFKIEYPKSWRPQEGKRPNVVQTIVSENGRGLESIVLV